MSLTLAMDELFTDPRYAGVANHIASLMPVGFRDQAAASAAEAVAIRTAAAEALGSSQGGYVASPDVPDWIRLGAFDALAGFITGKADTCMHNPHPSRPQPLVAAAWKPGLIVCPPCSHLLACKPDSVAERTCDGCGHECQGPDVGDGIYSALVHAGSLIYEYGVCERCKATLPAVTA